MCEDNCACGHGVALLHEASNGGIGLLYHYTALRSGLANGRHAAEDGKAVSLQVIRAIACVVQWHSREFAARDDYVPDFIARIGNVCQLRPLLQQHVVPAQGSGAGTCGSDGASSTQSLRLTPHLMLDASFFCPL